jgi:HemY protein
VLLIKAQLQQEVEDTDGALQTLHEVLQISPRNPEASRIQAEIHVSRENWQALEQSLPLLRKLGKMSVATLDEWTTQTWSVLLSNAGSDKARGKQLWKALPRSLREVPELVVARAQSLLSAGEGRQAESMLRAALKLAWHDDLVLAYGALEQPSAADRLKRVEQWLLSRSEDPILLLVAARLCMATELWGKARSYYESSAAIRPQPQTWYELGQLLLQLGEQQQAFSIFQKSFTPGYGDAEVPRLPDARMEDGQPAA